MRVAASAIASVSILVVVAALSAKDVDGQDERPAPRNLSALQAEHVEVLRQAVRVLESAYRSGSAGILTVLTARSDLIEAELEAATTREHIRTLLERHSDVAQSAQNLADVRHRDGSLSRIQYLRLRARWLEREMRLIEVSKISADK